ncbi:MAG: carboxylating nicotinate-nucleotide diphosphorylase [Melioribacteraceae bacterium]
MKLTEQTKKLIALSLEEDIGSGDVTTRLIVGNNSIGTAEIISKDAGVICGVELAKYICRIADRKIKFIPLVKDGNKVSANHKIAKLKGSYGSLLTLERTLLNFLQRMSGIATETSKYVQKLTGTKTLLLDTRKTAPGHRQLDKYAVKTGGGTNHRIGLFDMILIKENHITAAGSITHAVQLAERSKPKHMKIEVETSNLEEVKEVLNCKIDVIMLDNIDYRTIKKAVRMINGKCKVEASGGINIKNIRKAALSGVDYISVGSITHSTKALDLAMYIQLTKTK